MRPRAGIREPIGVGPGELAVAAGRTGAGPLATTGGTGPTGEPTSITTPLITTWITNITALCTSSTASATRLRIGPRDKAVWRAWSTTESWELVPARAHLGPAASGGPGASVSPARH